MLRHACGFKLANDGHDTRALQHYLGHKNIQHTVRYPEWRPIGSRTFGGVEPERPLHDAFVGFAGAGKLGTSSGSPSISVAARRPSARSFPQPSQWPDPVLRRLIVRGGPGARSSSPLAPALRRLSNTQPATRAEPA